MIPQHAMKGEDNALQQCKLHTLSCQQSRNDKFIIQALINKDEQIASIDFHRRRTSFYSPSCLDVAGNKTLATSGEALLNSPKTNLSTPPPPTPTPLEK